MRTKYLLGATKNKEIVFGEFELMYPKYWSKDKGNYTDKDRLEFSAMFETVIPFSEDSIDLVEYFEDYVDCIDKATTYDLCERKNCSPQDLPQELADECTDPRDAIDCSLYPYEMEIDGEYWYFESGSCGQHDTRREMEVYTNKEAYDLLHKIWVEYHLKNVNGNTEVLEQLKQIENALDEIDEEEWIENYIRENF